jgi:hypothetical protein
LFSRTASQILDRSQTVTRRVGWRFLEPGDLVQAIEARPGSDGARAVRPLAVLRIRDVRVERLSRLISDPAYAEDELPREGFPCWSRDEFVTTFCRTHRLKTVDVDITRLEFEHVAPDLTTNDTKNTKGTKAFRKPSPSCAS